MSVRGANSLARAASGRFVRKAWPSITLSSGTIVMVAMTSGTRKPCTDPIKSRSESLRSVSRTGQGNGTQCIPRAANCRANSAPIPEESPVTRPQ